MPSDQVEKITVLGRAVVCGTKHRLIIDGSGGVHALLAGSAGAFHYYRSGCP